MPRKKVKRSEARSLCAPEGYERLTESSRSAAARPVRAMVHRLPPVSFDPWDINYVIVATEGDVLPMFHEIQRIKRTYGQDERDTLCTKIISAQRISRDF
jgi:hypothetical protein